MKVIAITLLLSGLFIDVSFAKTINPDDSYEEHVTPRRQQRPKRDPRSAENEEEEFIHRDDTFVG